MALNSLGSEKKLPPAAPVTLPTILLRDDDDREIAEAAAHVAERKIVRAGRDCWEKITEVETFTNWLSIGKALQIGKSHALRVTGVNQAWGRNYSLVFGEWMKRHGFSRMQKSVRSVAIELAENAEAITAWRDSLPERQRRRLVHPLSVTRRWRLANTDKQHAHDVAEAARTAWRRFVACVEALPPADAAPLWQLAHEQAAARLT